MPPVQDVSLAPGLTPSEKVVTVTSGYLRATLSPVKRVVARRQRIQEGVVILGFKEIIQVKNSGRAVNVPQLVKLLLATPASHIQTLA